MTVTVALPLTALYFNKRAVLECGVILSIRVILPLAFVPFVDSVDVVDHSFTVIMHNKIWKILKILIYLWT